MMRRTQPEAGALSGVQVVEAATDTSAAIASMLLGDAGADVVRFESKRVEAPTDTFYHRNKRRVLLDEISAEELSSILSAADVCIVDGGTTALGERIEAAARENQRLIVLKTDRWTGEAPWGAAESHGLLAAWNGLATRQASFGGQPVELVHPHLFTAHGVWAAACVTACLVEREKSGYGQRVEVDGTHATLIPMIGVVSVDTELPDPASAIGPFGRHPMYSVFECADGAWLACGALGERFESTLLEILDITWVLHDEMLKNGLADISKPDVFTWLRSKVMEAFKTLPRSDWLKQLASAGIPCGAVGSADDWLDHPQVRALGNAADFEDSRWGHVTTPGVPFHLDASGTKPPNGSRQVRAQDVDWQGAETPVGTPPLKPGPLAGIRVINTGTFVAGPYSGSLMAELGADVIKVEPVNGDPWRGTGIMYNRGMRSLALDLSGQKGQGVFHDLAGKTDVVMSSLRPGTTTKLGIDHATLAEHRPDIITSSISGFGEVGPMRDLPGVDMVLQAMSGMMSAQGGDDEPVVNTLAIIDFTTAALTCFTVTTALYERERNGRGQHVWTSLADVATFLQGATLVSVNGQRVAGVVGGRDFQGRDPGDRFYATKDGWVRVYAKAGELPEADDLSGAGIAVNSGEYARDQGQALGEALSSLQLDDAVVKLRNAGLHVAPARRITEVLRDPALVGAGRFETRPDSNGGYFSAPGRYAKFGRTSRPGSMTTPGAGEHTGEILNELYDAPQVDSLESSGVVQQGRPMPQRLGAVYR